VNPASLAGALALLEDREKPGPARSVVLPYSEPIGSLINAEIDRHAGEPCEECGKPLVSGNIQQLFYIGESGPQWLYVCGHHSKLPNTEAVMLIRNGATEARERDGWKLLPKWHFAPGGRHKCYASCDRCHKRFRICPDDRCYRDRPGSLHCPPCSKELHESRLLGKSRKASMCPNCWRWSICEAIDFEGDQIRCLPCGYRWDRQKN
jgi:ssDNA-binding Zn-finger/Zn-ribbon topoisomerase 1